MPSEGAPDGDRGLPVTGRSLPQLLKNNGYATALIGKWHLGYTAGVQPERARLRLLLRPEERVPRLLHAHRGDGKPDLWENDRPVEVEGYMTDLITRARR